MLFSVINNLYASLKVNFDQDTQKNDKFIWKLILYMSKKNQMFNASCNK